MRDEIRKIIRDAFLEGNDDRAIELLRNEEYRNSLGHRSLMGFHSGLVAAGSCIQIVCRAQLPFKITRIMISQICANDFFIDDIKIGNRSLTVQSGSIPADLFSSPNWNFLNKEIDSYIDEKGFINLSLTESVERLLMGISIDFPTARVAEDITIMVTNITGNQSRLHGAYFGTIDKNYSDDNEFLSKQPFMQYRP